MQQRAPRSVVIVKFSVKRKLFFDVEEEKEEEEAVTYRHLTRKKQFN